MKVKPKAANRAWKRQSAVHLPVFIFFQKNEGRREGKQTQMEKRERERERERERGSINVDDRVRNVY